MTIRILACVLAAVTVATLTGCAFGGEGVPVGPEVVVEFTVRMAAAINDGFYYFIPIDTDGDFGADGPIPVAAGPFWENGWGTGSFSHFIEYHQGQYNVFRTNLQVELTTPGGGITAISGVPTATDAGTSVLSVQSVSSGAVTVGGAGMIASAANTGFQAAGTLDIDTNAAGQVVAGSVSFAPATSGGRALTTAERAVITALNAGGVSLASGSLSGLGLTLTLNAPVAGSQTLTIAPTTATVRNTFTPAVSGPDVVTTGALQANTLNPTSNDVIPGVTIATTDFVAGGQATVRLGFSPTATLLGPPFQYTLPAGGNTLRVTVDLATLGAGVPDLSVNFITTTELIFDPTITDPNLHTYDALGRLGNRYVTFRTNQFQTINNNSGLFEQEQANDPTLIGLATPEEMNQVDIVDWSITIRRLR